MEKTVDIRISVHLKKSHFYLQTASDSALSFSSAFPSNYTYILSGRLEWN